MDRRIKGPVGDMDFARQSSRYFLRNNLVGDLVQTALVVEGNPEERPILISHAANCVIQMARRPDWLAAELRDMGLYDDEVVMPWEEAAPRL